MTALGWDVVPREEIVELSVEEDQDHSHDVPAVLL